VTPCTVGPCCDNNIQRGIGDDADTMVPNVDYNAEKVLSPNIYTKKRVIPIDDEGTS
jgi:hypothetical protein